MRKFPLNLTTSTDKLKELIAQYPDYPIIVMAHETANDGDWRWEYCSEVSFSVGEILDCETPCSDYAYTDRGDFEDSMEAWLYDIEEYDGVPEEGFEQRLAATLAEYEPFWKNCITIYVSN